MFFSLCVFLSKKNVLFFFLFFCSLVGQRARPVPLRAGRLRNRQGGGVSGDTGVSLSSVMCVSTSQAIQPPRQWRTHTSGESCDDRRRVSAASHGRGRWSHQEQPGGDGGLLVQVIFLVGRRRQPPSSCQPPLAGDLNACGGPCVSYKTSQSVELSSLFTLYGCYS